MKKLIFYAVKVILIQVCFFFSEEAQRIFMLTPWKMLLKRSIFFYFSFGTQEQSLKMTQTEMKLNWL